MHAAESVGLLAKLIGLRRLLIDRFLRADSGEKEESRAGEGDRQSRT